MKTDIETVAILYLTSRLRWTVQQWAFEYTNKVVNEKYANRIWYYYILTN